MAPPQGTEDVAKKEVATHGKNCKNLLAANRAVIAPSLFLTNHAVIAPESRQKNAANEKSSVYAGLIAPLIAPESRRKMLT